MKLDEKRRMAEALLCAAGENGVSLHDARYHCNATVRCAALDLTYQRIPVGHLRFEDRLTEAAYDLIETSPTLRREWFGAR